MIARYFFIASLLLCLSCSTEYPVKESLNGLTVLHLEGSSYDRGFQHGREMKEEIRQVLNAWRTQLPSVLDDYPPEIIEGYLKYVDSAAPELVEEVRGIADGSGIGFLELFAFQAGEELENIEPQAIKHCTSISTNRPLNAPVVVAQNMDAPPFLHGHPLLLHIRDKGKETFVFTSPGLLGLDGMNSEGVAISCNSISMLRSDTFGMPVAFIVRKCLEQNSFEEAMAFLDRIDHSTPQAYTLGDPDTSVCLECSPAGCYPFFAFEEQGITLHTNFAVANRDFNEKFVALLAAYGKTTDDPYYCPRYFLAYDLIMEKNFRLGPGEVMDILGTAGPGIEPISNDNTYGSLVMVLEARPSLYIAPGKPDTTNYLHLRFDRFSD